MGNGMKCSVIRDLIPSYIDGLSSIDSDKVIEDHLSTCKECNEYYIQMKKEITTNTYGEGNEFNPFIKIKRNAIKKIFLAIFITASILAIGWEQYTSFYLSGKSIYSKEVEVDLDEKYGIATLVFEPKDESVIVEVGRIQDVKISVNGKAPLETLHLVKKNYHERYHSLDSNQYQLYFVDDDTALDLYSVAYEFQYEEDDYFAVVYNDGYQIIYLKDLQEGKINQIQFIEDSNVW